MNPNYRLQKEREQRGWSQTQVAEQIGTDAVTIGRWELGLSSPSPYFRASLCELFDKHAQALGFPAREGGILQDEPSDFIGRQMPPVDERSLKVSPDTRNTRIVAASSYLLWWLTGLPILLLNSQNDFILFHSLQSVLLFGCFSILYIVCILLFMLPFHGIVLATAVIFFLILNAIALPMWMVAMWRAWKGIYSKLPFVGGVSEKLATAMSQRAHAR